MKHVHVILLVTLMSGPLFSQEVSSGGNEDKKVISFYASVGTSRLINSNYSNDPNLEIHYPAGLNVGGTYTKYFSRHIGLTIGAEYSVYKNNLRCDEYTKSSTTQLDSYGSAYYTITQADYTENRKVNNVEIPICLRLESAASDKIHFFTDLGIKLCSSVSSSMVATGGITTMGLYPDPNYSNAGYLVWNQAVTGWQTTPQSASNDYRCKNLSWAFSGNAGVYVPLGNTLQLTCSAYCTLGLGDINDSEKGVLYTNYLGEQKAYAPSTISSFGMRLGVLIPIGIR
jgi:hypothetical protein